MCFKLVKMKMRSLLSAHLWAFIWISSLNSAYIALLLLLTCINISFYLPVLYFFNIILSVYFGKCTHMHQVHVHYLLYSCLVLELVLPHDEHMCVSAVNYASFYSEINLISFLLFGYLEIFPWIFSRSIPCLWS